MPRVHAVLLCCLIGVVSAEAAQRKAVYRAESLGIRQLAPPRSPEALSQPEVVLAAPSPIDRTIKTSSRRSRTPLKVGLVRPLVATSSTGPAPTSFRSMGAARVRLNLQGVSLPAGAVGWVFGKNGQALPFGAELIADGELWTPSVEGDTIALSLPAGARGHVAAVAHVAGGMGPNGLECLVDATCYAPSIQALSAATAVLEFVSGAWVYTCTGTLINGIDGDSQMLTANHCIQTDAEASSVEAQWDYRTASCSGTTATKGARTNGATLLVTSYATDVTLLRMASLPPGRWFMGWDSDPVPPGTTLIRVSHPSYEVGEGVYPQVYSTSTVDMTVQTCEGAPRPDFIYSTKGTGGIGEGASGAAAVIDGEFIVGQINGLCGFGEVDGCDPSTDVIDGALRASYPVLQSFIDPAAGPCTPSATVACLINSRFRVSVNYRNQFTSPPAPGDFVAGRLDPAATTPDVGIFGLGTAKAVEVVVRIADARPFEPRYHVYYAGLTDLEYWVTVTDTTTGTTRTYHNAAGNIGGGLDRGSFAAE